MNDLEEAIRVSRQAVAATPDDHPDLPILLYNLGNKLQSQYEKTGRMDELDEAIRLSRQAVEATPIENPSLTGWLSTLGNMLETRYGRTGHLDNLEEAIRVSRQAIEATPVGHPDLPIFLSNFENKLQIRYEQTGRMGGLGEVTSLSRQTSQAAPDDLRPPPSDSAHMHNRYVFSPYGGSYYPPSKYADLSETPRERTMSRHRVSRPRPSSSFHSNPPTVDSGTYSPLYGDNEPVERPVERGTSRDGYGRAVAAYIQDPDEDFYRMPPTIPLPMPKVKGKAAPQIHEARHFKPHEAQTSPAMPSQRRPSRSMDRDIERYRYLDRFNIGDLKAELPVVSDRSYSQMSRETALLERANSLRDSHRRSTSYQDNRRGAQVAVASSKRRQPTTYNYKDEPSSNMGDNLEDRDHEIKNYQAARSGRNPTDGEPSSAEAMLPKATTNRQGQRSRSNSSGGSGGSGTDEETEEDKETTLLANGVKMGFDRKTIEEQTINILAGETHNAIRLNIAGGRRPKQYVTRSNLDYAGGASRREFEDLRRTRGDSRSERGLRRSSQSTYGSTRTMHQSQYGQTRRINSIEEAKRLSPQAVDPGHKATSPEMTHEISSSQATGDRIVDKRLPGSDRDPGYASMLHTTTSTVSSEPASPVNFEMLPSEQPSKIEHIDDHEIQSPVSDIDKIGSQKSDETAYEEKTGKALLRVFLAEDPLFRTLCEKAILQMGQNRFAKNMRRLLKSYYKNLSVEAESEAERAAAKLLRSRQGRQRISQQLAVYILQQNDENWIVHRPDLQVAPEDKNRVEAWLTCNSERPLSVLEYEAPTPGIESSTSCSESDSDVDEFPNVSDLKLTLRGAWSFQTLLRDFMLLFLSPELKTVLLSIPKRHIWLSEAQDLSFVNWVKVWIEDRTETTWNWWPLESAKQPLKDGESRMFWICSCGKRQWEEISPDQRELVKEILALSDDQPQSRYVCRTKGQEYNLPNWLEGIFRKRPKSELAAQASTAARKYTPSENNASASQPRPVSSSNGDGQSSASALIQPHRGNLASEQRIKRSPSNLAMQAQSWILFGIYGSRKTLTPTQILVDNQSTDYSVFQELRDCYHIHRGRLRLWFSIWRLENCEVVKFNRLTLERMVREHEELPTHQDYQYNPRAGATGAKNPPISPHLFEALFYSCRFPCSWPIPHDCMHAPTGVKNLERIPKRKRCFERDQTSPIWGLETVFAVSFAYVLMYHCVIVAGPFGFFVWWIKVHPGDLQDASIPLAIVLGALSLFWSGAGILTGRKRH